MNPPAQKRPFYKDGNNWIAVGLCLLGILAGWGISHLYYVKAKADLVKDATDAGRKQGYDQGFDEGSTRGRENALQGAPEMIERRFPGIRQEAYDAGFEKGKAAGKTDGVQDGRQQGLVEGREDARKQCTLQRFADRNWSAYAAKVNLVAMYADIIDKEPSNKRNDAIFLAEATALTKAAEDLRTAFSDQAGAFNSTQKELQAATTSRDVQQMKRLSRTIRGTLETKKNLFDQANQNMVSTFDDLGKNLPGK